MPEALRPHIPRLSDVSRALRRDRELAFYGSEDLTPSEFYRQSDADDARRDARWVVERIERAIGRQPDAFPARPSRPRKVRTRRDTVWPRR